jgi:hypothetical protein
LPMEISLSVKVILLPRYSITTVFVEFLQDGIVPVVPPKHDIKVISQ